MPLRPGQILLPRPEGLYCEPGDFFIDPMQPVKRALITHGHSDHARAGHGKVLATRETLAIMAIRCGAEFCGSAEAARYGESFIIGAARVSFHPAGHVLGSAQILVEAGGIRFVVSGDYKRARDPTCPPFEPLACDVFVSEATFGLPVFRHPPAENETAKLLASVNLFPGRAHIVGAYPLGKAQRIMALLREAGYARPVYIHGAMEKLTEFYRSEGIELGDIRKIEVPARNALAGEIIIAPPSAGSDLWSRRFADPVNAFASGWMRVRARARQRGAELPLVISDHADWNELTQTVTETGCSTLWVTHGQEDALVHWAKGRGLEAKPLRLAGFGEEEAEAA